MKRVVMTVAHYKELCTNAPPITLQDVKRLETFIPSPTPIAKAVWAAYTQFRRI